MAYGIKYRFRFQSIHDIDYTVNILKDGYTGSVLQRHLGKSPVLKKSKNGCIYSTSLTLTAECAVDGEFADFYTSNPGEFLVSLFRGNTEIWQGSLMTEVFDAPEIAPPYDIQIVANDGIAEAKLHNFVPQGAITLKEMFRYLLADTPVSRSIYMVSGIGATSLTPANFLNTARINLDYMEGKTKYEVLTSLLETLHATITVHNTDWLIVRETDVQVVNGGVPCLLASSRQSTVSETSIANAVKSAGQMGVADVWPVGHLSTHVVPAKRRISVEAPWHTSNGMPSVPDNEWTIVDTVVDATFDNGTYLYPHNFNGSYGEVYAAIPLRSFTSDLKLSLWLSRYGSAGRVSPNAVIWAIFYPETGDNLYYDGEEWTTSSKKMTSVSPPRGNAESGAEFSFDIPCPEGAGAGTLVISVEGRWMRLHYATLYASIGTGYKDTISINNGSRGDGATVEIAGGRVTDDTVISEAFLQGVFLLSSGAAVLNFYDRLFQSTNQTFMSLIALGYATSVALPRLQLTGTVDVPSSAGVLPLLLSYRGVNYWIETFELDTREEELRIEALSLPAAQLTVESEVVTVLMAGSASGAGAGSPGASAATMISAMLTRDNIVGLIADQTLIPNLYVDRAVNDGNGNEIAATYMKVSDNFFELDGNGNVKLKDAYGGLWASGFITAGGTNSGGGGGGGVDLDRVWESLTNNTDEPDVKINAAHIPVASTSAIGGVRVDGTSITINNGVISAVAQGTGSVNSLTVGNQNYTPDANGVITIPAYPTSLPASDVSDWAKASTKPSYSLSEITGTEDLRAIEALTGTGFLKRTGTNTWAIDSSTYLTAVPKATDSVIGGFQTGYSESGKNYAVKMSGNKAYVSVPWTDTVYTHPTDGANVTIGAAAGKVLSAITVNNLGHVTSVSSKTLAKADIPTLDYLPLTGGELTGDLWLHTGSANYGSKLWFGDKGSGDGYAYIHEDTDDHLHIHADKGIKLSTGNNYGVQVDNNVTISSSKSLTLGDGVLTWDSTRNAWKLTGNFYATGFLTAGGVNVQNGVLNVENNVVIDSSKTVTFGSGAVLSYSSGWKLTASLNVTALTIGSGSSAMNVASVIADLQQRVSALENQ